MTGRTRELAWLLFASLATSACAFSDVPLTLPTRALEAPQPGGSGREVIVVSPFTDEREVKRCGMQKNGYNMDTADAVCQGDPGQWLATLLANELRVSGFTVLSADAPHKPGALRIQGRIGKLFVEPVLGFFSGSLEADLFVRLDVKSDTGLVGTRGFFVKGWRGGQALSVTGSFNAALDRATQQALEEMVRAVIELMDRYPQLGWRDSDPRRVSWLEEDAR